MKVKYLKKVLIFILIIIAVYFFNEYNQSVSDQLPLKSAGENQGVINAVNNKLSDVQVSGAGNVSRILSDDNYGDRHQRFILRLSPEHTVLIAHNIDLAPRVNNLKKGDVVGFYGEYEWNSKGGVVHWTHHDPNGRHKEGWLKHNGRVYK